MATLCCFGASAQASAAKHQCLQLCYQAGAEMLISQVTYTCNEIHGLRHLCAHISKALCTHAGEATELSTNHSSNFL